ncbi:MAG TPA: DUF6036 family nucleotidyltransferase [Vicinamibacterales bacterium]|nr:DUF6036 family nucleotidyltransferase [Vicinamibacterales bacterium]
MRALGDAARGDARVYFTGGATAVLHGFRTSTLDVDVKFVPERDELYRAIPGIKERLALNVELASPADFIPVRPDWEDRSPFIGREGRVAFHHFDLSAQALAKIERGHAQDLQDVSQLLDRGLVQREELRRYFEAIEAGMYRYPSIDVPSFRSRLARALER